MNKTLRVGILGLGVVGQSVVSLVKERFEDIKNRTGVKVFITAAACRDLDKTRNCNLDGVALTSNPLELVKRDDIDIVIEVMGGVNVAKEAILAAIESGKHVITANKALIAESGNEIFEKAAKKQVAIHFEAAVAGGIPIVKSIREGLAANKILSIVGIINGTCNYILSEMSKEKCSFSDALQKASDLGYAEADPSLDINGTDARHKLSILASLSFGIPLAYEKVYQEGIDTLEPLDVQYAEALGYRLKHLGVAVQTENGVELSVHPALVSSDSLIAKVDGVMNAVEVIGDAVGPVVFYGAGAGGA